MIHQSMLMCEFMTKCIKAEDYFSLPNLMPVQPGFSLDRLDRGGRQVQGDNALMGAHEGGHRPYERGPNSDRL